MFLLWLICTISQSSSWFSLVPRKEVSSFSALDELRQILSLSGSKTQLKSQKPQKQDKIELNSSKQFISFKQEIETKVYDQSEVIEKIYKII